MPLPAAAGAKRLHSGSKHKSLAAVLQLGRAAQPGHSGRPASHMPLAVIVDDRVEVRWLAGWLADRPQHAWSGLLYC